MENTRLERQARGRAGRQGEPGLSLFYTSLEDDVVSLMGEDVLEKYVEKGKPITKHHLKKLINKSQQIKEEQAIFQRKNACDYDSVMKRQRTIMYGIRNDLLDGIELDEDFVSKMAKDSIQHYLKTHKKLQTKDYQRYILDHLSYHLNDRTITSGNALECLMDYAHQGLENKEVMLGEDFRHYVRLCTLKALDDAWVEEVDYLQQLQAAISGRSSAQRNLLYEYQKEARTSFENMENIIKEALVRNVLLAEVEYNKDKEMFVLYP